MFDNEIFDRNIEEYWKYFGLTENDFHCRECGKLMIDFNSIGDIRIRDNGTVDPKNIINPETNTIYVESEQNRWLITGRKLSGKTYFRHLCWDCFFKHLPEVEDIPKRARKSSWYKDINEGNLRPPARCTSPSKYFKLLFDITDEELEVEHKKFDTASLESFIRRHGEKEGHKKYEEYKKRQAYTCSKEYMMKEKGLTEEDWNRYNESRACTEENFISRYGEILGKKKWKEYCDLESYVGCRLEYFIEKYGKEKGKEMYLELNKKKAQTLENYIRVYGEEEGKKRYANVSVKMYSEISHNMFLAVQEKLGDFGRDAKFGISEVPINLYFEDGTCRTCYPDYLLNTKIIEFNGDYWHANPLFYSEDEIMPFTSENKWKFIGNCAKDVWEYDNKRKTALEKLGYKVKIVWENDYNLDTEKTINECVEFLKS